MEALIVEPIAAEVQRWLASRHAVHLAPALANDPVAARVGLSATRAAILPAAVTTDASVLWHAPHLRVVGQVSAGVENIDLDACARAGVEVARAPGASAAAEAEPGALDPGRPLCHIDTLQVTPRVTSTRRESRPRSAWIEAQQIDELLKAARPRRPPS